ncbi:MAG: transcription antitermination factor NusB [Solobacterium sp.]|nr:transcription antitermination factor NusB [Solobacterium sp.]
MRRHENRKNGMILVYQYLIFPRSLDLLVEDNPDYEDILKDDYMMEVIKTATKEKERYVSYLSQVLDDWKFDRLGYIEQAILLCGCAEFDLKKVEAPVIIDEYVRLAKEYCDTDSYKLINGVLDRV